MLNNPNVQGLFVYLCGDVQKMHNCELVNGKLYEYVPPIEYAQSLIRVNNL